MGTIKLWASIVGLVAVCGGVYKYLRNKTVAEAPAARTIASTVGTTKPIDKSEERPSGKFNAWDYHFKPGKAFEAEFKREISGEAQKQKGVTAQFAESKIDGKVTFHGVKYESSTVSVVAHFDLKTLQSPLVDFSIAYEFGVLKGPGADKAKAAAPVPAAPAKPGEPATATAALPAKFKNSILLELTPSGRIRRILRTTPGMSDEGASLMSEAVTAMLYRWPEESPPKNGGKVTRDERDETGKKFKMDYEYTNSGSDEVMIKGIAVLEPPKKQEGMLEQMVFEATSRKELVCAWDKKAGVPKSLNWSVSQEVKAGKEKLVSASATVASTWKDAGDSIFSVEDLAKFNQVVDLDAIKRKRQANANTRAQKKGKDVAMDWNSARAGLGGVEGSGMTDEARDQFFNNFAEVLKDNPALLEEYKNEAIRYPAGARQVNMILGAMGYVGDEDAQKAMIDLYKRPGATPNEKEKVLIEMALSPQALTPDTKEFLQEVYKGDDAERSQQAGYALGASITKDPDPALVDQFKREIASAGGDTDKKVYLLQVMGNNKGTQFQAEVNSAYSSSDPQIRAAAIDALRWRKDEEGRNMLFAAIARETEPGVKTVAYRALQYQPYDTRTRDELSGCANREKDDSIRSVCYDVLLAHMQDAGTRDIIARNADRETSEPIKFKLRNALSQ
ncbi:MAG: hypothetical protein HYW49_13315 [Deltaproteobacteria bacterium]|nr:hypothetical protein [Deltaproteobacteria bacterium]